MEEQVKETVEQENVEQEESSYRVFEDDGNFVKIKDEILQNIDTSKAFIAPILSYKNDGKITLITYGGRVPTQMLELFEHYVKAAYVQFSQTLQAHMETKKFPDQEEDEAQPVEQETEEVVYADEESENDGQKTNERVD